MFLKISLIILFFIILGILILFGLIIYDIRKCRYKVEGSILEKEAEEKYEKLFPDNSIKELKSQIEKIAEILIAGEESNRYSEVIRQKVQNDERIQEINDSVMENVELVKYVDDVLKARIKYRNYENQYTLILCFSMVSGGRVFLDNYFVFKNKLKLEIVL